MKKNGVGSIKTKLLLYFIPVTVAVLICAGFIIGIYSQNLTHELATSLSIEIVKSSESVVEEWLMGIKKEMSTLAVMDAVKSMDRDSYIPVFNEVIRKSDGLYETLFAAGTNGISYNQSNYEADIKSRPYFNDIMNLNKDFSISNALISSSTGNPIFVMALPVKNGNKTVGMLGVTITLNKLTEKMNKIKIGKQGFVFLADGTGIALAHPSKDMVMKFNPLNSAEEGYVGLVEAGEKMVKGISGYNDYSRPDGTRYTIIYEPISHTPNWSLGAVIPMSQLNEVSNTVITVVLVSFAVLIGVMILISFFVGTKFSNPVKELSKVMNKIANYDLEFDENSKAIKYLKLEDEIGTMTKSLAAMESNLRNLVGILKDNSQKISSSADSLASIAQEQLATSEELSSQAQQVDNNVQNTSASIEEVTSGVEEVAASAQNVSKTAQELAVQNEETSLKARNGEKLILNVTEQIERAAVQTVETAKIVKKLAENARNVEEILDTISSIAEQTNLLALNAAIEAARAGEAGKGFAVVADEIRKLAEESKSSTTNISNILKSISIGAKNADDATHSTVETVEQVNRNAAQVEIQFKEILSMVEKTTNMVENLTASSQEQGAAAEEMASAMDTSAKSTSEVSEQVRQMTKAVEQQSIGAQQVSQSAEDLNGLAAVLEEEIGKFKV